MKQQVEKIVSDFFRVAGSMYDVSERAQIQQKAIDDTYAELKKIYTSSESKLNRQLKKRNKFVEMTADAEARLQGLTTEEIILTGLLEAEKISEKRAHAMDR